MGTAVVTGAKIIKNRTLILSASTPMKGLKMAGGKYHYLAGFKSMTVICSFFLSSDTVIIYFTFSDPDEPEHGMSFLTD
jgi:hypothetical protein